jgi:hypothetical protein
LLRRPTAGHRGRHGLRPVDGACELAVTNVDRGRCGPMAPAVDAVFSESQGTPVLLVAAGATKQVAGRGGHGNLAGVGWLVHETDRMGSTGNL